MDIINLLPAIKNILAKTIGQELIPAIPVSPPIGKLPFISFYMGKPSGYRPGTFFTCVETGDIFMHDGWKNGDGLGVVMMWRKNEYTRKDSTIHVIEWTTGTNNFMYGGEVRLSSSIEIEDFMMSLVYGTDKKKYYGQ